MRMIIPLVQKHCINGISKEDAENIKVIPELDERVTALESGTSGTEWEYVDYQSQTSTQFARPFFKYGSADKYFTKDVKVKYHVFDSSKGYDVYLFFPKGSKFNSFGVNITRKQIDSDNKIHYFVGTRYFPNTNHIMDLGGDNDGRVTYQENGIEIIDDNGSLTFNYVNTESYVHYDGLPISFWYRK